MDMHLDVDEPLVGELIDLEDRIDRGIIGRQDG
jgi:hypothetical protein